MVPKRILRLEEVCRRAPKKMAVGSCVMQRMSHVEMLDAGKLQCWIRPTSLGSSNVADCVKVVLPGPRRDLVASIRTEAAEGAPNTGGNPQMTRQHPQRSQDTGTKKMQIAVAAALHKKVPRSRRATQTSDAVFCCLRLQGEDSVDPREISSELLVQEGGRLPPEHAPPGNSRESRQDEAIQGCSSRLATLLPFSRRPEQSAVDPLAEGEEGDAEELW
ncbi:hypothetical protein NDU88_003906 [Pleurodeles waltl]|uniref:Uncharacterized protein n=1 Tax=Pleurodeles waltl TaxID=8319 RepID=A0AAV7N1H3_PLEWA|nr:hypothetical protein NDU88_003906 [Pleurodeles waltl]